MIWPPDEWAVHKDLFLRTAETPGPGAPLHALPLARNSSLFEVDAQGRLLLTAQQRTFAQIVDQVVFVGLGTGVEIVADELWQSDQAELSPAEFTQVWDLVHQRGTSASPSPGVSAPDGSAPKHDHPPVVRGRHGDSRRRHARCPVA